MRWNINEKTTARHMAVQLFRQPRFAPFRLRWRLSHGGKSKWHLQQNQCYLSQIASRSHTHANVPELDSDFRSARSTRSTKSTRSGFAPFTAHIPQPVQPLSCFFLCILAISAQSVHLHVGLFLRAPSLRAQGVSKEPKPREQKPPQLRKKL